MRMPYLFTFGHSNQSLVCTLHLFALLRPHYLVRFCTLPRIMIELLDSRNKHYSICLKALCVFSCFIAPPIDCYLLRFRALGYTNLSLSTPLQRIPGRSNAHGQKYRISCRAEHINACSLFLIKALVIEFTRSSNSM